MTRLSPPSPAGNEWLIDADDREIHDAFLGRHRELRADRPAGGGRQPGRHEKARSILESVERGVVRSPETTSRPPSAAVGGGIDCGDALGRHPKPSRTGSEAASPSDACAAGDGPSTWSFCVTGLVTSTSPAEETGDPTVAGGQCPGAQCAHAHGGRNRDGQSGDGHRSPVAGSDEVSGAGLQRR